MADYYGAPESSDNKTLRERLRDRYDPADFVTVKNTDHDPLTYQFMRPEDQEFMQPAAHLGELYNKSNPVVEVLQPGQTKLCPAYEADIMLEVLIKKVTSRKMEDLIKLGQAVAGQSVNWSDPQAQNKILRNAYLGKQDLIGSYNATLNKKDDAARDLDIEPHVAPKTSGKAK